MINLPTVIVKGIPKSIQAQSVADWKQQVTNAARQVFSAPLAGNSITVRITVFYNKRPTFDTDNISKPIVDALNNVAFIDDKQVMERTAKRQKINGSFRIKGVEVALAKAIAEGDDFVCIEVRKLSRREVEILQ